MMGLFGSLKNVGLSAADALDFIPGLDPVPERQGAVRGMFGSLAPRSAAQTPPIVPQGMKAPQPVQPIQKRGMMAQPPGGVPMTGLERYSKPLTLPQLLTMSGDSRRAYNQGRDAHSATQAQMQFDMQQGQQSRQQAQMAAQQAALERSRNVQNIMNAYGVDQARAESIVDNKPLMDALGNNLEAYTLDPRQERGMPVLGQTGTNSNTGTVIDQTNRELDIDAFNAQTGLMDAETNRMDALTNQFEASQAAQSTENAGPFAGLPAGVQSAITKGELDNIEKAEEALNSARNASRLSRQFMSEAEGYNSLGGGFLADIGQTASHTTARLKGITAEQIPMMRMAGEGIMTDADAKRYESAVNSINKNRASNQAVTDNFKAAEQNAEDYLSWLNTFRNRYGYGGQGQALEIWQEYSADNPIFDDETGAPNLERKSIEQWLADQEELARIDAELSASEPEQ